MCRKVRIDGKSSVKTNISRCFCTPFLVIHWMKCPYVHSGRKGWSVAEKKKSEQTQPKEWSCSSNLQQPSTAVLGACSSEITTGLTANMAATVARYNLDDRHVHCNKQEELQKHTGRRYMHPVDGKGIMSVKTSWEPSTMEWAHRVSSYVGPTFWK